MTHVEHWNTTLRIVREFGGAVLKEELIYIVHYVLCTVPCVRKSRLSTNSALVLVTTGSLAQAWRFQARLLLLRLPTVPLSQEHLRSAPRAEACRFGQVTYQGILPLQDRLCRCLSLAQEFIPLPQFGAQPVNAKVTHTLHCRRITAVKIPIPKWWSLPCTFILITWFTI